MAPVEILEDIFAYFSRDDLDYYAIICLKWSKIIETSKRLTQCRVVSLKYGHQYSVNDPNNRFWMELKSSNGKIIHIEDDLNQQELSAFRVFKNTIIDELVEFAGRGIHVLLEKLWAKIFKLAGGRIIVKRLYMRRAEKILRDNEILKNLHDFLPKYIKLEELTFNITSNTSDFNDFLFDRESWKCLDFGKKTKLNIDIGSLSNNFPIDTFKEFISGRYMENPKLNELVIGLFETDSQVIFSSIVEAFCSTDDPQKFFKNIKSYTIENFDEMFGEFEFVRDDLDPQKYRLSHPKLKWALEATHSPGEYLKFKPIEL